MSSLFIIIHKFFCDIFCPIIVFTLFILNASCFVVGFGIQKHIQFFFHFVLQYLFSSFLNALVYVEIDWGLFHFMKHKRLISDQQSITLHISFDWVQYLMRKLYQQQQQILQDALEILTSREKEFQFDEKSLMFPSFISRNLRCVRLITILSRFPSFKSLACVVQQFLVE